VDLKRQDKKFPYEAHMYGVALGLALRDFVPL
jgi:hypothetical protein